MTIQNWSHSE